MNGIVILTGLGNSVDVTKKSFDERAVHLGVPSATIKKTRTIMVLVRIRECLSITLAGDQTFNSRFSRSQELITR